MDFAIQADHRIKLKESKMRDYLDLAEKKLWNMKLTTILIVISMLGIIIKGLVQGLEDLELRGQVEIIQTAALITKKSPGDLRRLAVIQTSVKNYQLTLMGRTLK